MTDYKKHSEQFIVERDDLGPYVVRRSGGIISRTLTVRGAIRLAKKRNREEELENMAPAILWEPEDD